MPATAQAHAELLRRREAAVARGPFQIHPIFAARALGSRLWDIEGRAYLDFAGGIGVLNVGHNHPRVVAAVRAQAERFLHTCWHVVMYEDYVRLAERLGALVPTEGPNKAVFFNSGAEAGENAVKIARVFTGRPAVVAFERGFHGRTLLAMSLTGSVLPYTAGFGPFAPEVYRLPYEPFFAAPGTPDAEVEAAGRAALDRLFRFHVEPEAVACLMMEPVLGEGGFFVAHPVGMRLLREACRRHGILFVSDEVQTGFGRCGAWFACQRYGIVPDLVVMAKSLAGGLPLSAVCGPAAILDAPRVGGLGGTFGGNPLACAAALAALDVIEEEGLAERALRIGASVMEVFEALRARHAWVGAVRGLGAMCGMEVVDPATRAPDKERAGRIVARARELGLLLMTASGNVVRTLMPLTIGDAELEEGLAALARATEAGA
jgi:4-aminobutyrate aminotransferase/(S)-3-amino-2-methylpropionate transaminase